MFAELLGKGHLRVLRGRETPTGHVTAEMERAVNQNRAKTSQQRLFGLHHELESEGRKEVAA